MARTKLTDEERKARRCEYIRKWRKANHEKIKEQRCKYYEANREKIREQQREYREANHEGIKKQKREHYTKNAKCLRAISRARYDPSRPRNRNPAVKRASERRLYQNTNYKLARVLRSRLRSILAGRVKGGSAVSDLGCTIDELRVHLESLFGPGMTWDNWTTDGWHLDHIIPLSSFDLTDSDQLLVACHYTNLQPLWAKENLLKGARL